VESTQLASDVRQLRESLQELPEPVVQPALILLSGLPGTGKSYLSRRLAEHVPLLILESDLLRKTLFSSPGYSAVESFRLFRAVYQLVEELLREGISLILDATNLAERFRERLYGVADRLGARMVLIKVEAPPELVKQRLEERAIDTENHSDADWAIYRMMSPAVERIRRNHYAVDTSRDISSVIDKVVKEVTR